MEFSDILAVLGLLLAVYGLADDYIRIKLKLIPLPLWILFWFTIGILFIFSFNEIKTYFVSDYKFILLFFKYEATTFWDFKYPILISLNMISIFIGIKYFTSLRRGNENKFLSILHTLAKEEEYALLNKLSNNNIVKILELKNKITFKEKYLDNREIVQLKILKTSNKINIFFSEWMKKPLYKVLSYFSYHKNTINEIYNFIELEPNIKNNELIGFEKLKILIEQKSFDIEEYSKKFLIPVFKNHNSYITRQLLQNSLNEIKTYILKNSDKIQLNFIIGMAIKEILEESELIIELEKEYDGKNSKILHIEKLLFVWTKNNSSMSSTVNLIEQELLKYSELDKNSETNAFYLLKKLFDVVCQYIEKNMNDSQIEITYLHDLYLGIDITNISERKQIQLACFYIEFLMANNQYFYIKLPEFKKYVEDNSSYKFFLTVINKRDRELCEEKIGFGVNDEKHSQTKWNELVEILQDIKT